MTPSVSYDLTLEDLQAFWDRSKTQRRDTLVMRLVLVTYTLILAGLVYVLWHDLGQRHPDATSAALDGLTIGIFGTLLLVVAFARVARRHMQRRTFAGSVFARGPIELRGDETELQAIQAGIVSTVPWSSFVRAETAPQHVFLYLAELQPLIVPRAVLAGHDLGVLINAQIALRS